jgi:hypothetical protein
MFNGVLTLTNNVYSVDSMHLYATCSTHLLVLFFTSSRQLHGFVLAIVSVEIEIASTVFSVMTPYKSDQQIRTYIFITYCYYIQCQC